MILLPIDYPFHLRIYQFLWCYKSVIQNKMGVVNRIFLISGIDKNTPVKFINVLRFVLSLFQLFIFS